MDEKFRAARLDRNLIDGYHREETRHLAVARCVARGEADVGIGKEKAALQAANIDFVPMQEERYELVIRRNLTSGRGNDFPGVIFESRG